MAIDYENQLIGTGSGGGDSSTGSIRGLNPHPIFARNMRRWQPILDIMGGQSRLYDLRNKYLPQQVGEKDDDWLIRTERAMLRNFYKHGIGTFSSSPFSRPVSFSADAYLPSGFEQNVDGAGSSLTLFAERVLRSVLNFDLAHIGVFLPSFDGEGVPSQADFEEQRLYPYFRLLPTQNVFDWVTNLREQVTELREVQYLYDRDHQLHTQVIYYDAYGFKVLKAIKTSDGKDVLDDDPDDVPYMSYSGDASLVLPRPPIVQCYAVPPEVPMQADPPFGDCAQVNLEVYSQDNELNHYEHTAMTRFQVLKQVNIRDIKRSEAVDASREGSADNLWTSSENYRATQRILIGSDGDIFYVGPDTGASEARTATIIRLVEYLESRFSFNAPGTPRPDLTATQTLLGTVAARALVRSAVSAVDEALTEACRVAYRLMGRDAPSSLSIVIDRSYEEMVIPNPGASSDPPAPTTTTPPTEEGEGDDE